MTNVVDGQPSFEASAPRRRAALLAALLCGVGAAAAPRRARAAATLRVGPGRDLKTLAEAATQAQDGDTIEVDAGEYVGDVAVWPQAALTWRAIGGRVRLLAQGAHAEGKGTWVLRHGVFNVEGFDFIGAAVPSGNGAGIRLEKGQLRVRDCSFTNNENGILTSNHAEIELDIDSSEFGHNGRGDGQSHNLYAGTIARLSVTASYFHHARVGHLLKSRAAVNHVVCNRLTDEAGGSASYELEFPNGGVAVVIGNLIQQGPQTENPVMVSYGIEGFRQSANELTMVNNTLIDNRAQGGVFVRVKPGAGTVKLVNNLLVGPGDLSAAGAGDFANNVVIDNIGFESAVDKDYRWKHRPSWLKAAIDPGMAGDMALRLQRQYMHPRRTVELARNARLSVGAIQPGAGLRAV